MKTDQLNMQKMPMDILVVVDMQKDFIDGALGSEAAVNIVPDVVNKSTDFKGLVFYTRDTHQPDYLDTQEGKKLPVPHCIIGTEGWQLNEKILETVEREDVIINKPTFGSDELCRVLAEINLETKINSITLVGLCTDICVISNAMLLKAFLPETEIVVDAKCCAGVTKESHETALKAMEACQIRIINR